MQRNPNRTAAMRYSRRRVMRVAAGSAFGIFAATLASCGSDDAPRNSAGGPAATSTPAARTTSVAKPVKPGGKHTTVWENEPSGVFDPHTTKPGFVSAISTAAFDGFYRQSNESLAKLIPQLAEKWETPDPATFLFRLRPGVTFHDGTEYNAEVAKYNAERIISKGYSMEGKYSGAAAGLTKVEVVDPLTIKFTFDKAKVDSFAAFAFGGTGLSGAVSRKHAEAAGQDAWKNPVGTGPFMFKQWDFGSRVLLVKNPQYFAAKDGAPYLDEFEQIALPEPAVRAVNLENGRVSSTKLEPDQVKAIEDRKDAYVVRGGDEILAFYPNHQSGVFKNVHVRRALGWAINRDALAKIVFSGQATPAKGIPPHSKWHDPTFNNFTFDPQKVKDELNAAGMPNGFSFECMVLPTGTRPKAVEFMQSQLATFGIKVDIKPTESQAYVDRLLSRGEGDCFFALSGAQGLGEVGEFAYAVPAASGKQGPNDPKMIEYVNQIATTFEEEPRRKLIQEAQRYYWLDLAVLVSAVGLPRTYGVRSDFAGFEMLAPQAYYPDYRGVHLVA